MTLVAHFIVQLAALYLVGLGMAGVFRPAAAARFLGLFASTARFHYVEQALRLIAGIALVVSAPAMRFSGVFVVFGWVVVVTTIVLLLLPWRWHRRYAEWAVPLAVRHLSLFAAGALMLGAFILYASLPPRLA